MMKLRYVFTLALAFVLALSLATAVKAAEKPNIVLINMDNFGYGELGVYGGGILRGAPRRASTS